VTATKTAKMIVWLGQNMRAEDNFSARIHDSSGRFAKPQTLVRFQHGIPFSAAVMFNSRACLPSKQIVRVQLPVAAPFREDNP
jgi:hypothetical protein